MHFKNQIYLISSKKFTSLGLQAMEKHSEYERNLERLRSKASSSKTDLIRGCSKSEITWNQTDTDSQHPEVSEGDLRLSSNPDQYQHVRMFRNIRRSFGQDLLSKSAFVNQPQLEPL